MNWKGHGRGPNLSCYLLIHMKEPIKTTNIIATAPEYNKYM